MGGLHTSVPPDDSQHSHFLQREGRRFIGEIIAKLKSAHKPLPIPTRRKRRSEHLTNMDLWQLLQREGYVCDPTQVRRILKGDAPVDPYLASIIARALNANAAQTALLSHAAGGDGVATYMLKLLGLETFVAVCAAHADEAVRGEITVEEFDSIVQQMAGTMLLELIRTQQSLDENEHESR